MPYIDPDYYKNVYKGKPPSSEEELNQAINRASEMIDILTGFKLSTVDINSDTFNTMIRERIKKATAAQTEYILGKNINTLHGAKKLTNVRIGNFNYSSGGGAASDKESVISDLTLGYLSGTGLLYSGVDSFG